MKIIQPETKIDEERLSMSISKIWTTRKSFKILPITNVQAYHILRTFVRMEVESKCRSYKETESIKYCMWRIASFLTGGIRKRGLFFSGKVGNGKTTMLKCIAKLYGYLASNDYIERKDNSQGFMYITAQELSLSIIDNKECYEKHRKCKMLIIDDVGEDATEIPIYGVNRNPIKDIIMYRYEHDLVTIISSNLNASLIKAKYHDERLSDRMREMYEVVAFEDDSFRI